MDAFSAASASNANEIFWRAGEQHSFESVHDFFSFIAAPAAAPAATSGTPSPFDFNSLLANAGKAPGATTVVTVPEAPISGDMTLIQNVQTLDSYIAVLTALVMYQKHPEMYDLGDKKQARQFTLDLANARNFVVTGGVIKDIPMFLPMDESLTQTIHKSATKADLHLGLLNTMFDSLSLSANTLKALDGVLTEVANSLATLELSSDDQSQTVDHFISFYHLVPFEGANPPVNQMKVTFIFIKFDQHSWETVIKTKSASATTSHFDFDMTMTVTDATMSSGIVAAKTQDIINALAKLTEDTPTKIAELTKMKAIQTQAG